MGHKLTTLLIGFSLVFVASCHKDDTHSYAYGVSVQNGLDTCLICFSGLDEFSSASIYVNDSLYDSKAVVHDSLDFEILNYNLSPGTKTVSARLMSKESYVVEDTLLTQYTVCDNLYGSIVVTMNLPSHISEMCDIWLYYSSENSYARMTYREIDGHVNISFLEGYARKSVHLSGEAGDLLSEKVDYTLPSYDTSSFHAFVYLELKDEKERKEFDDYTFDYSLAGGLVEVTINNPKSEDGKYCVSEFGRTNYSAYVMDMDGDHIGGITEAIYELNPLFNFKCGISSTPPYHPRHFWCGLSFGFDSWDDSFDYGFFKK